MKYLTNENVSIRLVAIKTLYNLCCNAKLTQKAKSVCNTIITDLLKSIESKYRLESFYASKTLNRLILFGSTLLFTLSTKDIKAFLESPEDSLKSVGLSVYNNYL